MTKSLVEIDENMVLRTIKAMGHAFPNPDEAARKYVRGILTAALTPDPEPEIRVTSSMRVAGWKAMWTAQGCGAPEADINDGYAMQEAYRAMRKVEMEEQGKGCQGSAPYGAERYWRPGPGMVWVSNQRSGRDRREVVSTQTRAVLGATERRCCKGCDRRSPFSRGA